MGRGGPGLPERRMLSTASCFPKTHGGLELLWPEDLWMVDLWRVSPGSSQEAAERVTPLPRGPSAFTLLHLSLPPPLHGPCFSAPRPKVRAPRAVLAWAGVQPAVPESQGGL